MQKMVFLFEKEVYPKFKQDKLITEEDLPQFIPYDYGPFSKQVYDDLEFLIDLGFVETEATSEQVERGEEAEYWLWEEISCNCPILFMDELSVEQWLEINAKAVEIAKTKYPAEKVVMQVVIGKGLLLSQELSGVIERVISTPADIVAVWIDDFDETLATITELTMYKDMLSKLGSKKEVLILYGSYFSVALMKTLPELNIKGVCHGLEYADMDLIYTGLNQTARRRDLKEAV
ncbi:MAG: hypothetical protein ACPL5F_12725 [Moorellaceae bacterium]